MRSVEGSVVLKRFLLIFSDLIIDSRVWQRHLTVPTPVLRFRGGQPQ